MKIITNPPERTSKELQQIILDLQASLHKTENELTQQKVKYAYLLEQFRLSRQQQFSASSEKNILQADLFDEAGIECEATDGDIQNTIEVKTHQRKQHPVRKPLPKDLPREIIIHDLNPENKICDCGSSLTKIGEEITEQLKFIPAQLSVLQHIRPKYACKPCQGRVMIAPQPLFILPKTNATPELLAHTIISKYSDHIPLYRQAKIWDRVAIDLPRSTLCSWLIKVAECCEPLIDLLHRNLMDYDYLQADESPIQVLKEPGRANTSKSYLWVYKGGGKHPSVVFDYQQTRGGYHAQTFLQNFKGYLQTDAYSGYHFADKNADIIRIGCMAHARRPFAQLAKLTKKEGLATQAITFFKSLYAIEAYARDNQLDYEQRAALRNEKAPAILDALHTWINKHIVKLPKQHQMGKAMFYVLNNWEYLIAYLKDGRLNIDNNPIENLIRPMALGRRNYLFMGSPKGAKAGAIFYSLIATCTANDVNPYRYFCMMLARIRTCKTDNDYRQLLPQFIEL